MGEVDDSSLEVAEFAPLSPLTSPLRLPADASLPTATRSDYRRPRGNSADSVTIYHEEEDGWLLQPERLRGPPDHEHYDSFVESLTHTCARVAPLPVSGASDCSVPSSLLSRASSQLHLC